MKTRLGLYKTEELDTWIPELLAAKPDVLIVHGRTMQEASKVLAHWDLIARVAQMCHEADVLCVGNGDVMSRAQGLALAEQSGVDGIMVGRGIFHNPWLFSGRDAAVVGPHERLELLLAHTDAWVAQWDGIKSFDLMKKFYKVYVSGWPGSAELRARLMEAREATTVRELVTKYLNDGIKSTEV